MPSENFAIFNPFNGERVIGCSGALGPGACFQSDRERKQAVELRARRHVEEAFEEGPKPFRQICRAWDRPAGPPLEIRGSN